MIDLNSPWPWPMTTLEKFGFYPALAALVATIAWDWWKKYRDRRNDPRFPPGQ